MSQVGTLVLSVAAVVLLYFVAGACFLRFGLEPLLLPYVGATPLVHAPLFLRLNGDQGNGMVVRRYGTPNVGCVIFFPGQHGMLSAYEKNLFPAFSDQGISVLAVAYPGQNGAPGMPHLREIRALAARVFASAQATCPGHRVVVYGRSLGSMVAAYAAEATHPSGLILESAAASLSSAIRVRLRSRWYLAPLDRLPVASVLAEDYSLAQALSGAQDVPVVVFQGAADTETPLSGVRAVVRSGNVRLFVVPGGLHSNTYLLARDRIVRATLSMLRAQRT